MFNTRLDVINQGESDHAISWCGWEDVQKDDNWLVSFVDLLIILLATLVVLIGQMAPKQPSLHTSVTAHPPSTVQSRGVNLARLVEQRFQGEISAMRSEQGVILNISDAVLFDSARATLRDSATPMLIRLAATLQESGDARVAVEGHTDDRPVQSANFDSNWQLAAARANAVTAFLIDHGLAAERLRAVSYADTRPTAGNDSAAGRAANRRVELRVEFSRD